MKYDARGNVTLVTGQTLDPVAGISPYSVRSAFDAKNRRVFKSFTTVTREAQWFFYYDALDRLSEVRYTPDIATPAIFSTYQLVWLGDLLVATSGPSTRSRT